MVNLCSSEIFTARTELKISVLPLFVETIPFMWWQGALAVRNGLNRENKLHFFHAFALSSIAGFGGGWMGFVWLGLPSSMITSDIGLACCIIAYAIVNWTPYDLGFKYGKTFPILAPAISLAQLFRSLRSQQS